jgi:hypothetical protein
MVTFIEALFKSDATIKFGWNPEPGVAVSSYKIYVGKVSGSLTLFASGISPTQSNDTPAYKKITYDAGISSVISLLGLPSTSTFDTLTLYWAITYVNSLGAESSLSASRIVEVPPVGIMGKTRKEDPTANRNIFGFSEDLQKWIKTAASSMGAIIVSSSGYYQDNITTAFTYDSSGRVSTEKYYRTDMTVAGAPAKLVRYTYGSDSSVSLKVVSDSTV